VSVCSLFQNGRRFLLFRTFASGRSSGQSTIKRFCLVSGELVPTLTLTLLSSISSLVLQHAFSFKRAAADCVRSLMMTGNCLLSLSLSLTEAEWCRITTNGFSWQRARCFVRLAAARPNCLHHRKRRLPACRSQFKSRLSGQKVEPSLSVRTASESAQFWVIVGPCQTRFGELSVTFVCFQPSLPSRSKVNCW
jgi:hypothetical protein